MAIAKQLPPQEFLRECFEYDPETGVLRWRVRPREHFESNIGHGTFNAQYAGKVAGSPMYIRKSHNTYRLVKVTGIGHLLVHRTIHKLMTGEDPDIIDHINGDGTDNRWVNLRSVSRSENNCNKHQLLSNNTSGVRGVQWHKKSQRWVALIIVNRKRINLGTFTSFDDAVTARRAAEVGHGFNVTKAA